MRFGCCVNMIAKGEDGTGVEHVERLAEYGYDYVEMPLAEMMALSENKFAQLAERIQKAGIPCETCNNFFPKTIRLTGPEADEEKNLLYVEKALGKASSLGVQSVVFGSGGAKNVPSGFPMEEGYGQVVSLLRKIEPIAKKNHITIVIEPLRRAECNLINTFAEGCKLAQDVGPDYENVKVLVDFYHLSEEKEPVENLLLQGKEYLRHVHFARSEGRVYPKDMNEDNYRPFIDALKKIGYDARVSVEAYADDFDRQARGALQFLRENF
ncbi:sugar phosphate isomerase/epimerase family protein [Clostridium sp. KNHs216]|uniref:sugar phosphate isomerase/epimerase family protein n=1 Tax=Clostridium sp. KNHs216 TaxID=1550235 RepID=UPI001151D7DB|nr:sugar phosphate isomerase/epimerase family protein [Clostridium sp. KNHs216]TQI66968.1 sugar phosphate isomerase/epimerase [Clostridium sp. KNHs216]